MPTTAAERRRRVLEHARDRRRRQAAERKQEAMRRATFLGGAIGLVAGVVLGQLLWDGALAGPSIAAVIGLAAGACAGAAVMLGREQAEQRVQDCAEARAREEERARRRDEARRERKARPAVAAPKLVASVRRSSLPGASRRLRTPSRPLPTRTSWSRPASTPTPRAASAPAGGT
ncbi:MAG TPA: hypothetical protein VHR88_08755, partial [Solirubrobacteraceae bacterium]|nr:hypothetical protein [Solirubrobacteraceae bacterium]